MKIAMGVCAIALLAGCTAENSETTETDTRAVNGSEAAGSSEPSETKTEDSAEPQGDSAKAETAEKVSVACADDELTVFSCKAKNGKQIAVCASEKGVDYRYGKDSAELSLKGKEYFSAAYSGGGEIQLSFDNKGTQYIVFSRIVRTNFEPGEPNNPAISDGVIALSGEKVLNVQVCDDPNVKSVDYDLAAKYLEETDGLFTEETARADPF